MKNKILILSLIFTILTIFSTQKTVFAQYYDNSQTVGFFGNFSINASFGITLPFADISQDFSPYQEDFKTAFGVTLRKQFSPYLGIGAQFIMGNIRGTQLETFNSYFESEFTEINFHTIVNLSNLVFGYSDTRTVHLYGTIGIGFANWATIRRDLDTHNELSRSGFDANGTKAWSPSMSIPFGMGLYFAISKKFGANIEGSLHMINSDELDAYPSGKSKQDYYTYFSVGLTYNLSGAGNVFRRAGKEKETDYEKEARKLQKYQDRQAKKLKRERQKEEMDVERKTNIEKAKRSRRDPLAGMPKLVEYDAVYSMDAVKKIKKDNKSQFGDEAEGEVKGEKELVFDEGKHFITGVDGSKGQAGFANIISAKDALKEKSDSYTLLTVSTDGTGRGTSPSTTIISGGVQMIPASGKVYTVQILASRQAATNINTYRERYSIHQPIYYSLQNGMYRYSAGMFTSFYDAQTYANVLKRNGLGDAFVATYNNGIRVIN